MKRKSIIGLLIGALTMSIVGTSCQDMLSPDSERHSYNVAQDTLYSYWGILKSLQNVAERYIILGECRGDLVAGTEYLSDSIQSILNYDMEKAVDGSCRYLRASDYYHIINSCNAYLDRVDSKRMTGTRDPYMLKEAAQVEAIRAWVYLQLVQVYGEVPFYTKPLLTTDDINSFMQSPKTVTAQTLVDELAPSLKKAQLVEMEYGMPQYDYYGKSAVHSEKCMIPLNVILGDLYLTKGDAASCAIAAQYYYDYFSANQGLSEVRAGGVIPSNYHYSGHKADGELEPTYTRSSNIPWNESGRPSASTEAVTSIPSSTNKLWGNVLRGVNDVFGFDSEIYVATGADTSTVASVVLTAQYDKKQLYASKGYQSLCGRQAYEVYVGTQTDNIEANMLQKNPSVGDARQYWISEDFYQNYASGVLGREKFITKQNPYGVFTPTFPLIYRKSQLWLRYAEALNRAGYPSHAFAILSKGLCNNPDYIMDKTTDYNATTYAYHYHYKDTLNKGTINQEVVSHVIPAANDMTCTDLSDLADLVLAQLGSDYSMANDKSASIDRVAMAWDDNMPSNTCDKVLNFIDLREVVNRPPYLNFGFSTLNGNISSMMIPLYSSLSDRSTRLVSKSVMGDYQAVVGIHSHGAGFLSYSERRSSYNYVDQVTHFADSLYGVALTPADIYSGSYDDVVRNCVEDLILDEMALELAFEGTRFFDLMRVAQRRNDPSYLAKRVASRNGAVDGALQSKLSNPHNWYFPLPKR